MLLILITSVTPLNMRQLCLPIPQHSQALRQIVPERDPPSAKLSQATSVPGAVGKSASPVVSDGSSVSDNQIPY